MPLIVKRFISSIAIAAIIINFAAFTSIIGIFADVELVALIIVLSVISLMVYDN